MSDLHSLRLQYPKRVHSAPCLAPAWRHADSVKTWTGKTITSDVDAAQAWHRRRHLSCGSCAGWGCTNNPAKRHVWRAMRQILRWTSLAKARRHATHRHNLPHANVMILLAQRCANVEPRTRICLHTWQMWTVQQPMSGTVNAHVMLETSKAVRHV